MTDFSVLYEPRKIKCSKDYVREKSSIIEILLNKVGAV